MEPKQKMMKNELSMTSGAPFRAILTFATPLVLGYILQQLYLIIDAVIVGRWIGVGALAAVGASSSIMFLIMGFCNGACAGFAIPIAQAFGAGDHHKMRCYVSNVEAVFAFLVGRESRFEAVFLLPRGWKCDFQRFFNFGRGRKPIFSVSSLSSMDDGHFLSLFRFHPRMTNDFYHFSTFIHG